VLGCGLRAEVAVRVHLADCFLLNASLIAASVEGRRSAGRTARATRWWPLARQRGRPPQPRRAAAHPRVALGSAPAYPKAPSVLPVENLDVRVVRVLYLLCWSRRRGRTIAKDKATAKDKPTRSSEPSATTTSTAQVDGRIVYVSVTIYQSEQSRSHQPWNYPSGCSTRRGVITSGRIMPTVITREALSLGTLLTPRLVLHRKPNDILQCSSARRSV
jgi:hypothetical protein